MTDPLFQHIYLQDDQSYNILKVDRPFFVVPWHLHPEIEIMSIVKGEGSRFVGDSIENFGAGDLVMIGSNLPHCWKNAAQHFEPNSVCSAEARVILFKEKTFGNEFFNIRELKNMREMFKLAQRGICFNGRTTALIAEKINEAYLQNGAKRFISFLDILNDLAESKEFRLLSSIGYKTSAFGSDVQRLNKIINYLMENFQQPITLDEVAAHAYMSPTSFCRYFKGHTNKTVVRFLNELRIGYARKLLIENKDNISDIHYICGFQNASNFYEQFKKIVGCSPLQFRKQHEAKL
ncbi:AraC family transcriptional regulator [Pedobacter heparinus]|uniref:AraC family transcriptional regulator n=1 Tax=Pedobacter heparinus TaxID=984 RepID=UPI002931BAAA|nr:AraC family transcriptional regulator [Pedobacter heparinus]